MKSRPEGSTTLKAQAKAFWNRGSCDTSHTRAGKFTRDYFEQIEQWRYAAHPFIHSFAQFTRYRGKRVLEVGFGAGTDFIQWLRAGARVSGVDFAEEALANVTHRIQVYGLPRPEHLELADAEELPFAANTFDLGYAWGVLHHTPNTEQALAELVRVVRPGGEIKIMLHNRHSLTVFKMWLKYSFLKAHPWRSARWVISRHIESPGTKSYTAAEVRRMLAPLPLTSLRMETFITVSDRISRRTFPFRACNAGLGLVVALTGNRLGWFRAITARKL